MLVSYANKKTEISRWVLYIIDIDRKRTGPRILPFGTPHVIGFSSENTLPIISFCVLLLK